jgi:hypothetical protein
MTIKGKIFHWIRDELEFEVHKFQILMKRFERTWLKSSDAVFDAVAETVTSTILWLQLRMQTAF